MNDKEIRAFFDNNHLIVKKEYYWNSKTMKRFMGQLEIFQIVKDPLVHGTDRNSVGQVIDIVIGEGVTVEDAIEDAKKQDRTLL